VTTEEPPPGTVTTETPLWLINTQYNGTGISIKTEKPLPATYFEERRVSINISNLILLEFIMTLAFCVVVICACTCIIIQIQERKTVRLKINLLSTPLHTFLLLVAEANQNSVSRRSSPPPTPGDIIGDASSEI